MIYIVKIFKEYFSTLSLAVTENYICPSCLREGLDIIKFEN